MEDLFNKVEELKKEGYNLERIYDVDGIHDIMTELKRIREPYLNKMNELEKDNSVKEYICNKRNVDYISSAISSLISCLPK